MGTIQSSVTTATKLRASAPLKSFRTWAIVGLTEESAMLKLPTSHLGRLGLCVVGPSRPALQDCKVVFETAASGAMKRIEVPARVTGHTFVGADFRWMIQFTQPDKAQAYLDQVLER